MEVNTFLPLTVDLLICMGGPWVLLSGPFYGYLDAREYGQCENKNSTLLSGTNCCFSILLGIGAHVAGMCHTVLAGSSMVSFTGSAIWLDSLGCKMYKSLCYESWTSSEGI